MANSKIKNAEKLLTDNYCTFEIYEGYSGRGMYGRPSPGAFSTDATPYSHIGQMLQKRGFLVDNLGMDYIYYLR